MYILTDGSGGIAQYPYSPDLLRYAHRNTSFPAQMSYDTLAEWNVFPVTESEKPSINPLTQKVVEASPVLTDRGWVQAWNVEQMEEAESIMARENALDALRAERNARLLACDWTQMSDAPLNPEQKFSYAAYRQALRDLPEKTTDLLNLVWPVEPKVS